MFDQIQHGARVTTEGIHLPDPDGVTCAQVIEYGPEDEQHALREYHDSICSTVAMIGEATSHRASSDVSI